MRPSGIVALALPAGVFAIDPGGLAPAGPARFTAIALCLLAGAVALLAQSRAAPPGASVSQPALPTGLAAAAVGLLTLTAASTLGAVDRWHAVLGSPDRSLGLLTWIGFAIAAALGHSLGGDGASALAKTCVTVVGGLGAMAGLELLGLDPTGTAWAGSRVGAPFAQPTYLAAALVLLGPPAASVALDSGSARTWRIASGGASCAGVAALVATQSRGPMVGLVVALVIVAFTARGSRRRLAIGLGVLVCLAALGTMFALRGRGVIGGRIDEWQVGLDAVGRRPWLGFGPEGYRTVFPSVVDADYVRAYGTDVLTDRAHNVILDTAVSSGVAAAACLAVLMVMVGRRAVGLVADTRTTPAVRGLAVGVLAMFVQQLFLFPLAELDPMLWLFAGLLIAVSPDAGRDGASVAPVVGSIVGSVVGRVPMVVAAVAMAVSGWYSAHAVVGEHRMAAIRLGDPAAAAEADRALGVRADSVRLVFAAARIHAAGPTIVDLDRALDRIEAGLEIHRDEPALADEYGRLLIERAERSGLASDLELALDELSDRVAAAPNHPPTLGRLARALALDGQLVSARAAIRAARLLAPDDPELARIDELLREP